MKGFYHIWPWRHLGHEEEEEEEEEEEVYYPRNRSMEVEGIMSSDFYFLVPESFHTKFGLDRHSSF